MIRLKAHKLFFFLTKTLTHTLEIGNISHIIRHSSMASKNVYQIINYQ